MTSKEMRCFIKLILVILLCSIVLCAQVPVATSTYKQVEAAYQSDNFHEAERILWQILEMHPHEVQALSLMGVVLDSQKRYEEAETYYRKALELAPNSATLNNNLGNHYLMQEITDKAQAAFTRVVAAEPHHINGNLQLARIFVGKKKGREALRFLGQLPASEQATVPVQFLKAQALYWSGQQTAANELMGEVEKQAPGDLRLAFSMGMAYFGMGRFEEAEKAFTRALQTEPANFDILCNLGIAATRAGNLDRAEEVFQAAMKQRPNDADALFGLARVNAEKKNYAAAIPLLVKARQAAPSRAEILLLLASCSGETGFFGDEALAYDAYLTLRPDQDVARRQRGFALVRTGKLEAGLEDLQWYVKRHPNEALGLQLLGVAETLRNPVKALEHLDQALKLDPTFLDAHFARGALLNHLHRPADAIVDLQVFVARQPNNPQALAQLGRAYLELEQAGDAAKLFKRATDLAPEDPKILLQYSRALRKLGRTDEMQQTVARFQALGIRTRRPLAQAGLFDYLSLPPEEQKARYLAILQRRIAYDPGDLGAKALLGEVLLERGDTAEALKQFQEILGKPTDGRILANCGRILLSFEQDEAARPFFEAVLAKDSSSIEARINLVIVVLHIEGPAKALAQLKKTPESAWTGDFYLLEAQLLDSMNRFDDAVQALNWAFQAAPTRADLYFQAAEFLLKHGNYQGALDLVRQASHFVGDVPELGLTEAIALELLEKPEEAGKVLTQIRSRWPEWDLPYLIHGIILEAQRDAGQAKPLLETAIALGSEKPAAYYYLAKATLEINPEDTASFHQAISAAFKLNPEDPYLHALIGKQAYSRQDYQEALSQLQIALRYKPDLADAHCVLGAVYEALGEKEKSKAELAEATRLQQSGLQNDPSSQIRDILFTVGEPSWKAQP